MFIVNKFLVSLFSFSSSVIGITIYPFVFVKDKKYLERESFKIHEKIHLKQQIEMLVIPFYIVYILEFLLRIVQFKGNTNTAYRNISFEREAYSNEHDTNYLNNRKFYSWLKYIKCAK